MVYRAMSDWVRVFLDVGDLCRTAEGAPARYIGYGKALYVSASTNDLCVSYARMPDGKEKRYPLPSDEDVVRRAFNFSPTSEAEPV